MNACGLGLGFLKKSALKVCCHATKKLELNHERHSEESLIRLELVLHLLAERSCMINICAVGEPPA